MSAGRVLSIVSVVIFLLAVLLPVFGAVAPEYLLPLGLACFAGGHLV